MSKQIGSISFGDAAYKDFTGLPKPEQVEIIYQALNPKDYKRAEKLLKNIPHANISSGNEPKVNEDATTDTAGGTEDSNAGPEADHGKTKRVPTRGTA